MPGEATALVAGLRGRLCKRGDDVLFITTEDATDLIGAEFLRGTEGVTTREVAC
jgi:hypothetical protein